MIPETERNPTFRRTLLSCGVALVSLAIASCTSTGSGTQATLPQLNATTDGSVIADALQSAADQKIAAEGTSQANESKVPPEAAVTAPPPTEPPQKTEVVQVASVEPAPTAKTSLFGGFAKAKTETAAMPTDSPIVESKPAEASTSDISGKTAKAVAPEQAAENTPQLATAVTPNAVETAPTKVASLFGSQKQAFAPPPAPPSASQSSISRLFSDESAQKKSALKQEKAVAIAMAAPKSPTANVTHNYNYTLPGVRANGGIEIKHRNSMYDDSDIDADESDGLPMVRLASAPGLARLTPNGLRVQRETVDVACLKPELVVMLKTMERHYRRPVMITSGYRNPSYNLKVGGARKSLHMICAAADIQIDGVSKWEIARYVRALPRRGGVGTYCHTESVHVDIGPERDWNWRCSKRG